MASMHTMILDHGDICALRMALESQSANDGLNGREMRLYGALTFAASGADAPEMIFDARKEG